MSDSKPKSKAIPSWQQVSAEEKISNKDQSPEPPSPDDVDPRARLIEKASEFLNDDGIKESSRERKIAFLKSKGLTMDEISPLLGTESAQRPMSSSSDAEIIVQDQSPQAHADASSSLPNNQPPIITYPEFLLQQQQAPPIITAPRLLTTFYLISGMAATLYGTSKYIVEPMVESLTAARHTVLESASTNLSTFNEKLEGVVSAIPDAAKGFPHPDDSDGESVDSDPARHFSRTKATQTTPRLSRSPSSSSLSSVSTPPTPTSNHAEHLSRLHRNLVGLEQLQADESNPILESMRDLDKDLRRLLYMDSTVGGRASEDSITRVKAEIKGVKGVLLSARNFPSGLVGR